MSTEQQPEALRLADALNSESEAITKTVKYSTAKKASEELRRLHARVAELEEQRQCLHQITEPEGQWKPIETAPKDGTAVLVYPPTWRNKNCAIARYVTDKYAEHHCPYWRRDDDLGRITFSRETPPTHWMPLPPPPYSTVVKDTP